MSTNNNLMNSIQVIDDYFCKKEDEITHIKHIKSVSEFEKYKKNLFKKKIMNMY